MLEKPDIDVWYDPTYENYFRLLNVISELGKDTSEFRKEQTPRPRSSFFRLDFEEFSIDLLPEINSKIRFIDAFSNRIVLEYEGVTILLIALNDLIKDKESSGRTKDKEDIENLKRINKLP